MSEISTLSVDARHHVESLIALLKDRETSKKRIKRKPLREEEFLGMWTDREDMRDPTEWVRNLRRTHWNRPR